MSSKKPTEKEKKEEKEREEKEKLLQIAVKFLQNPDVKNATDAAKRGFLKKKGLSDQDIDKAFIMKKEQEEKAAADAAAAEAAQTQKEQSKTFSQNVVIGRLSRPELTEELLNEKLERANETNIIILRDLNINAIPSKVFDLTNLKVLNVSFNKLAQISDSIKQLTNLKIFHAAQCQLYDNQISDELWKLENLEQLNLSRNQLTNVENLGGLQNLIVLDLSQNSIFDLPQSIGSLRKLLFLNLYANNIITLPSTLNQLTQLKRLNLSSNLLSLDEPEKLASLQNNPKAVFELLENQYE